jgi:general secretion pathway protein J
LRRSASEQVAPNRADAGFTLVEALAALAIAGVLLAVIAEFAGRTLSNWNRGQGTIATMEMITRGLARMETDLSAIVPMSPPGSDGTTTYFAGNASQMVFVSATGFATGNRGVELLHFSVDRDGDDTVVVRTRGLVLNPPPPFKDPVQIFRGRMKVRFYYRDSEGRIADAWNGRPDIPQAVLVDVKSANDTAVFASAFTVPIRVNFSADCLAGNGGAPPGTEGGGVRTSTEAGADPDQPARQPSAIHCGKVQAAAGATAPPASSQ